MGTNKASNYKSLKILRKTFLILHKRNCCELNLGESLCMFAFYLFSDSGLYLLNGFYFYFDLF